MNTPPLRAPALGSSVAFAIAFAWGLYIGAPATALPLVGRAFAQLSEEVQGRHFLFTFAGCILGLWALWRLSGAGKSPLKALSCVLLLSGTGLGLQLAASGRQEFWWFCGAALLAGAGLAPAHSLGNQLLSGLFAHEGEAANGRRAFLLTVNGIFFNLGALSSPWAVAWFGWRSPYALGAGAVIIALLIASYAARNAARNDASVVRSEAVPTDSNEKAPDERLPRARLWDRREFRLPLVWLLASSFLYGGAEVALFTWMPRRMPGTSGGQFAVVSYFQAGMLLGGVLIAALLWAKRSRWSQARRIWLRCGASFLAALCSVAPLLRSDALHILTWMFISGVCFGGIFNLLFTEASDRYRGHKDAGTAFTLILLAGSLGPALVTYGVGYLFDRAGWSWEAALALTPISMLLVAVSAAVAATQIPLAGTPVRENDTRPV